MRALIKKIRQLLKDKRFRKIWYRGISATAAIVVFVTTYALVLPAITMESEASCGIPAHQHSTDCYEEQLICGLEESEGHHHTDDCYTVTKELTCTTPEHQHDETCFDEDGNLTCTQTEHTHGDTCYEEHRELTCTMKESEGHHHDSSCYKQVLTCGLEAHIHSVECYKEDSKAVTASTSIQASDDFDGAVAATAASTSVPAETYEPENASNGSNSSAAGTTSKMTTDDADSTDAFEAANASTAFDENSSTAELSSAAATTGVLPEPVEQEDLSEGYVPTLDPVNMDQVLDKHTGFYYYHAGEGEELPASSTEITSWKKVDDNTELAPTDLVKAYFAYTIPAGTLNETNQVARYRLPSNLHLTDDQIIAINQQENGIAASYIEYDTLQILDTDNYHKYLGAEAIEGTRTPDQPLTEGAQEYISAVVKAENVYDDEGVYGEKGAYLGQDLIFIFTPYTIEKNQNTYDTNGNPTSAGQKVSGWFACDFNMGQIDWVEAESNTDHDTTAIEKTADILFAAQDDTRNIKEISQTLKLVETIEPPEDTAEDAVDETSDTDGESAEAESNSPEETEDNAATSATEDAAEMTDDSATDTSDTAETTEAVSTSEEEPAYKDGTLTASGADYTITLDYTADACITENAELKIREITKESDPEAYDACLSQAKEQVIDPSADENKTVDEKTSRFFDIEIMVPGTPDDTDEIDAPRKIEPKAPVNVNIHLTETTKTATEAADQSAQGSQDHPAQTSDPTVLHFLEDGVETIESTSAPAVSNEQENTTDRPSNTEEGKQIQFEASSFSVYGVVYTSVITTTYITASGETYEITVSYDAEAGIPEGATLAVSEIESGTAEYDDYLNSSATELGVEDAEDISFARFFNIEIHNKDGEKVEPKTPVTVQISYVNGIEMEQDEHLSVVHFADQGIEIIDNVDVNENADTITYAQESFSVTGTIVNGGPRNGQMYILVVEYEGQKYLINNDGTLVPAADVESGKISVEYPMLWTYYYQYGGHFRFASEASGFNSDQTASGYYYRYLDPNSSTGLTEENSGNPHLEGSTQINYNGGRISAVNNNNLYIGISDEGGTLHIVGQQNSNHSAQVTLYGPDVVQPADPARNSVNHIDISIQGSANVEVSLAYGDYYYFDDDTQAWQILHITGANDDEKVTLTQNHIGITSDDMKSAKITATKMDGTELDNAFYITGYSANETTAYSTDQVRIEGSFKVADIPDVINWWEVNSDGSNGTRNTLQERLNNKITYTVEAQKQLSLPLEYVLPSGKKVQLYEDTDRADPIMINTTVPLTASFDYWMYGRNEGKPWNECPPLQPGWGFFDTWRRGGIQDWGISGMDFVLHAETVTTKAEISALEIKKRVKDADGNIINLGNTEYTSNIEIYQDKPGNPNTVRELGSEIHDYGTYTKLHDRTITVNNARQEGHIYDYNVTDGMYYIKETGFPRSFQDASNTTWHYQNTVIKTEYVWRDNDYKNGGTPDKPLPGYTVHNDYDNEDPELSNLHETSGVVTENRGLSSIPEVVGHYTDDKGNRQRNEFLVFYIDNIYVKGETPPPPEPIEKTLDIELEKKWQDGTNTDAPSDGSVTFYLHQQKQNGSSWEECTTNGYPKTLTVSATDGWKLTIPKLLWYESWYDSTTNHSFENTYRYYLEEDTSKATGGATAYGVPSFTNGFGSINNPVEGGKDIETVPVEVVNKTGNVIRIQKRWINIDPDTAPNVTIEIWRQAFKPDGNTDGSPEYCSTIELKNSTDRVNGENWWQKEITFPTERPKYDHQNVYNQETGQWENDVTAEGDYAYFLVEKNPDGTNNNQSQLYEAPRYFKLVGDQVVDDYDAFMADKKVDFNNSDWNAQRKDSFNCGELTNVVNNVRASDQQDSTLIVINAPKEAFSGVNLRKSWYKYNDNGDIVAANANDIRQYAAGFQIYQKAKTSDDWAEFGRPFYIASDLNVINCDGQTYINYAYNPFKFESVQCNDGVWNWRLIRENDSRPGFPRYAIIDGQRVEYEYKIREIGVYQNTNASGGASNAEQLIRVYDYANTKEWTFDYQNHNAQNDDGARGINVKAGKLRITKKWSDGQMGSKVYFHVFQNGTNITEAIVSDPDSYGLTEHQVVNDDSHKAIIVKSDGTDFEEILIQGLPLAPAGGGTLYQYAIQEIGYAEADGTDCWDGENIIDSDGTTREDPHGTLITVDINELLTGYQIDGGSESQISGRSDSTPIIGNKIHVIQANNTYVEKYKDLVITKIWQDSMANFLTWPSEKTSITVDLYANGTKVVEDILLYINPPSQTSKKEFTWNGVTYNWDISLDQSGTIYTFTIHDLPAKVDEGGSQVNAVYEIREHEDTDFVISYGYFEEVEENVQQVDSEGHPVYDNNGQPVYKTDPATGEIIKVTKKVFYSNNNATGVQDGKVIRNLVTEEDGFELPSTGGSGTHWIYILGAALTLFAAGLLLKKEPQ